MRRLSGIVTDFTYNTSYRMWQGMSDLTENAAMLQYSGQAVVLLTTCCALTTCTKQDTWVTIALKQC
jgi:hypothetical protein